MKMGSPFSFLQITRGGGCPEALHHKVELSPSDTERSPLVSSFKMSGGTVNKIRIQLLN